MKRKRCLHSVLFGAVLDPLVDTAEDLFVAGCPIGKLHTSILAKLSRRGSEYGQSLRVLA
jgi:hypothetical protein